MNVRVNGSTILQISDKEKQNNFKDYICMGSLGISNCISRFKNKQNKLEESECNG